MQIYWNQAVKGTVRKYKTCQVILPPGEELTSPRESPHPRAEERRSSALWETEAESHLPAVTLLMCQTSAVTQPTWSPETYFWTRAHQAPAPNPTATPGDGY